MKIKFTPTGQEIEGDPNKTLLQLCTENQIEIKSICKGVPSCAECRVKIIEGEHNIVPPSKAEMSLIGTNYFIDHRRLSCQVHCYGDITVDLTEQIERAEVQNKKVRGFRSPHQKGSQVETQAKQGTLVLEEGTVKNGPHSHHEPHTPGTSVMAGHPEEGNAVIQQTEGREQVPHKGGNQNRRQGQGGGGGQNRNRQQGQAGGGGRGQQQGGGQNRGQGQGGGKGQQQAGGQNRGPQQGRNQQQGKGGGGQKPQNKGQGRPQGQGKPQNQNPNQQNNPDKK